MFCLVTYILTQLISYEFILCCTCYDKLSIQKGLPIREGPGIAYEHLLKEQSDAQKVVSSMQKPVYERILKEQRGLKFSE